MLTARAEGTPLWAFVLARMSQHVTVLGGSPPLTTFSSYLRPINALPSVPKVFFMGQRIDSRTMHFICWCSLTEFRTVPPFLCHWRCPGHSCHTTPARCPGCSFVPVHPPVHLFLHTAKGKPVMCRLSTESSSFQVKYFGLTRTVLHPSRRHMGVYHCMRVMTACSYPFPLGD